ncbi:hypothetical protein GOP47_0005481 [Adiantum capillus-veneris]|uniref:Uncharacterized protein n=1 Tax=Adiantum capillus-veneris TaxID=13818 RepID=A0A9D4ZN99_ADICA|nr:hypothetical protein GOP47_0005481 [Adiantum capillus-veneris]
MVQFLEDVAMRERAHSAHVQMQGNGAPPAYTLLVPGWAGHNHRVAEHAHTLQPTPQTCNILRPTPIIPTSPVHMMDLWGGVLKFSLPASNCLSPPC